MDITGTFSLNGQSEADYLGWGATKSYTTTSLSNGSISGVSWRDTTRLIFFRASDNWIGSTSEEGNGTEFSIMNPYRAVYIWKRTS